MAIRSVKSRNRTLRVLIQPRRLERGLVMAYGLFLIGLDPGSAGLGSDSTILLIALVVALVASDWSLADWQEKPNWKAPRIANTAYAPRMYQLASVADFWDLRISPEWSGCVTLMPTLTL